MADHLHEQPWKYELAVEFDQSQTDTAIEVPRQDTCHCFLSYGDVTVKVPQLNTFSFSFMIQGYNRDFLLFCGDPDPASKFFANFVCWRPQCVVLPRATRYTLTAFNGAVTFSVAGQAPKEDPKAGPSSKRAKLTLPKNSSALRQFPESMATPVKGPRAHATLNGDHLTFRLWSGTTLILNPCQLPDEALHRDWIRLNVGGFLFDTTRHVLLRERDTFFEAMLGSGVWEPNIKGQYEIDRSPAYFPHILTYLTSGKLDIWTLSDDQIRELQREMDYYSITSQCKAGNIYFDRELSEVDAIRLSLNRTSVKCILCTGDVRLVLPPGVQSGNLLLTFTLTGSNSDFMLYSSDDFSQEPFFANFYICHPNAIPIPALHRYVIKVAQGQVSFVQIGNPPVDENPFTYAIKVTKDISDATIPLKNDRLFFRLWSGVQIDLVSV